MIGFLLGAAIVLGMVWLLNVYRHDPTPEMPPTPVAPKLYSNTSSSIRLFATTAAVLTAGTILIGLFAVCLYLILSFLFTLAIQPF